MIIAFVCLSFVGMLFVPYLPVKLSPTASVRKIKVDFNMNGAMAKVVEAEATSRLEGSFAKIGGLKSIKSESWGGRGSIALEFDKYTDINTARLEVATCIKQLWKQLPEEMSYPKISVSKADSKANKPFMTYTLNAPEKAADINQYAEEYIKSPIGRMDGVNRVVIKGSRKGKYVLSYSFAELKNIGVDKNNIISSVREYLKRKEIGMVSCGPRKETVRISVNNAKDKLDLGKIYIKTDKGAVVAADKLLKQQYTQEAPQSYYRINGETAVYIEVYANNEANQISLAKEIKKEIEQVRKLLPEEYTLILNYDATVGINKELDTIFHRTAMTLAILLLFVLIATRDWKYLTLIVISLTANIAIAVLLYYFLNLEIQLYSLAGITISLNLIIDNVIIITDHIRRKGDLKAFMSIMAATLTTIGALSIIFFLDEKIRLNLQDFAIVVIVNLGVSLFIALLFAPSVIDKMNIKGEETKWCSKKRGGRIRKLNYIYDKVIGFTLRHKAICVLAAILGFGLPTFLLPIENEYYNDNIRPYVDKFLGGSLRLFYNQVDANSILSREDKEIVLLINANMSYGHTLEQMDKVVRRMESYLSEFNEIREFHTNVYSANSAKIEVWFTKEASRSSFPYALKQNVIQKALTLGDASWTLGGLNDFGFSNSVLKEKGHYKVELTGYNYDKLESYAYQFIDSLMRSPRVKEVNIDSHFTMWKNDYMEYQLFFDKNRLAKAGITIERLNSMISPIFQKEETIATISHNGGKERISLTAGENKKVDIWALMNLPLEADGRAYKLSDFARIKKIKVTPSIVKDNQQYKLCLQYNFVGTSKQGDDMLHKEIEKFNNIIPAGYKFHDATNSEEYVVKHNEVVLLLIIIMIVFFVTSILFNSLSQPFAIIIVIPFSFIGVFLSFYLLDISFEQGGLASMILLCGITVNASIYIVNEYNILLRQKRLTGREAFIKSVNYKVGPILLTILSTILGFVPFLFGDIQPFWFSLAVGTISGLISSLIGIFFFLPLLVVGNKSGRLKQR